MKVLIFNSLFEPNVFGGAERSVRMMADGLIDNGVEVAVASTSDKSSYSNIDNIDSYYMKPPNLYWMKDAKSKPGIIKPLWHFIDSLNYLVIPKVKNIIGMTSPDIIHTNNLAGFSVAVWKAAYKKDIPVVHTIRDQYLLCPRSLMYKNDKMCEKQCWDCRLYSIPRKALSKKVYAVIGNSKMILEKHLNHGYFAKARIKTNIYSAIDNVKNLKPAKSADEEITFGFVGLLAPIKGVEYLLRCFTQIDTGKANLKIFGKGITYDYENYLREKYQSDNIIFMGHRDKAEIYPEIDVTIIPSLCDEAFPRTLIESYSYGIPVVSSNRGGTPEMVINEKTGYVFDPEIDDQLKEIIRYFIANPEWIEEMKEDCYETAENFSKEKATAKLLDIYSDVLNRKDKKFKWR